jgi:hypothetical protein
MYMLRLEIAKGADDGDVLYVPEDIIEVKLQAPSATSRETIDLWIGWWGHSYVVAPLGASSMESCIEQKDQWRCFA